MKRKIFGMLLATVMLFALTGCDEKKEDNKKEEDKTPKIVCTQSDNEESMKDNEGFKTEIKEYTSKHRAGKKKYDPDKYFEKEDPSGRLYNSLYDKRRNPILPNKHSNMMKSSTNLLSNINLDDKKLFTERKKGMRRQFTNAYLTNENMAERQKLTEENVKGIKDRKFYKSKGFTYKDNNYITETKYVQPNQYPGNSSKITKQMELQSNIFGDNDKKKKMKI